MGKNTAKKGRPNKTFTFKSFNEHISEVKINLINKVDTITGSEDNDFESKFHATWQKFTDFNRTADFESIKKRLGGTHSFFSVIQVHDRLDDLAEALLNSLDKQDNLAADVTLELMVALATDVGESFYSYFEPTFNKIVKLLNTQDPRLIENIFMTLASFFKILSKCMISDLEKIFALVESLFSDKRPDYVRSFAAQSLTYLVRKIPDKENWIKSVLGQVDKDSSIISGVSCLLFEIVKGVSGHLHSCSDNFIRSLLNVHAEFCAESKNVEKCVAHAFKLIAEYADKNRTDVIWSNLLSVCEKSIQSPKAYKKIVSILLFFVSYKRGELIQDCEAIINFVIASLQSMFDVRDCLDVLLQLTAIILNYLYSAIETESRKKLIRTAFDTNITTSQLSSFVECLFNNRFFETDILPLLLERSYPSLLQSSAGRIADNEIRDTCRDFNDIAEILFKLISYKKPIPILETLPTFEAYPLDYSKVATAEGCENLVSKLLRVLIDPKDWHIVRKIVTILPHLIPLNRSLVISGLISLVYKLMAKLSETTTEAQATLLQTILSESIYSLALLRSSELFTEFKNDFFTLLFEKFPGNPIILQGFVFFYQYAHFNDRKDIINREFFETLFFNYFQDNLRHPRSQVRFLTLIAINLFDPPMKPSESSQVNQSIFSICLESEMVALTIHDYREKLRLINHLQHGLVDKTLPCEALSGQKYDLVPIHYLLGTLYYNFQPLWQPVQKMIQDYGRLLKPNDREEFWKVTSKHFCDAQNYSRSNNRLDINSFWQRMNQTSEANPRPDFLNHRLLLLQILKAIASEKSNVVESYGEEVVRWFYNFLEKEADSRGIGNFKREEDISLIISDEAQENAEEANKNFNEGEVNEDDLSEIELDEQMEENSKSQENETCTVKRDDKMTWKTITAFLELLAQFKNPKKIDKDGKLLELYHSLLQQSNPIIQKAALNCLLTYNDENIMPYKESLRRLLDDATFKTEILLFSSQSNDPDDEHVKSKHRSAVIPFVMRILYGKMLSKTGSKTSGKANIDLRQSIVFRFLASCSKGEIMLFLKLSFSDFVPFFDMAPADILESFKHIDIHKCTPLRYVHSALKTLELMLLHFGNVVSDLLPILYKILLMIAGFARTLLDQRLLINTSCVNRLKAIRTNSFKLLQKFFTLFESYAFTPEEIDGLFEALINTMIVNLANEGLEAPSPLLRLLRCWSENPRYFILFVKSCDFEQPKVTPLSCLIDLYSSSKASSKVIDYISATIANILSYANHANVPEDDTNEQRVPFLKVNGLIDEAYIASYEIKSDDLNFGTQILIPYISPILSRIKINLSHRLSVSNRRRETIIQENEAVILSHLSDHAEREEDCLTLVNLLIDTINYKHDKFEESAIKALESVNNLISKIKCNPKQFTMKLCRLFELVNDRNARLELCKIITTLAQNVPALLPYVDIIVMINAYNPRNPEEPDYTVREEGFSKTRKIIREMDEASVPVDWIKILIHNCVFFIATSEDLGLREASSNCLISIIKQLASFESQKYFINIVKKIIFAIHLKKGMKDSNERARHEWVTILSDLVKYGKEKDKSLEQLSLLSSEDADQDFWTNIRHIQVHRRIRALVKLGNNHELLSQFSSKLLHDYLLPVATVFINDLKETKYGAASSYAVDLIGSICCHLPWGSYQRLLRLYLHRIISDDDNHKSNVRILCSILTNFNYDLNKSKLLVRSKDEKHVSSLKINKENTNIAKQVLGPEAATRVHEIIINDLVPKLQQVLYKLSYTDYEYDNIRSEFNHEDEIQRMPIALAMVKLLDSVPIAESSFESQICSVFTRMSNFLKSRMDSIRESSRKILCKIMEILGAKYLLLLIREMKSILNKGFRVHVLTFTIYIILESMINILAPGDLDEAAPVLIEIFHQELFTDVAEEKSVGKITSKCKEAKKIKSYASYRILGKYISSKNLIKNMMPLKKVLDEAYSAKVIKKVTICMEKFFLGLTENAGLSEYSLVTFILNALEDKIPELKVRPTKPSKKETNPSKNDSLILKPEYKQKKVTKTNPISNVHVLFEYCLRLLLALFKKNRLKVGTPATEHLGKFVPILIDSLFSKHVKLTSTSLRCLNQYIRSFPDLPEFKQSCEQIKNHVLVLLDEFVAQGTNAKENVELVTMCFKTISSLVRFMESIRLDANQLKVLLFYIDKDMADRAKQSTAFSLLKAILSKKMESPEIKEIMQKLTIIMLHSEDDNVREECRLVWLKYLLNYSLGGAHFTNHITFFTRQLEYPRETGRSVILKLIFSLIKYQDNSQVSDCAAAFYIPLATRLINDDSYKCRELAATVLEKLLSKISKKAREILYRNVTLPWFQSDNHLHRRLAAQLFGLFATVEGTNFRCRLTDTLPLLVQQVDPTRFSTDIEDAESRKSNDHQLFQLLAFFNKILSSDPEVMTDAAHIDNLNSILFYIESIYLTYPHIWVRIMSLKIIASVFSHFPVSQVVEYLTSGGSNSFYIFNNLPLRLWNICKKHCFLFSIVYESNEIGDILVKNLHYIARILLSLSENFKLTPVVTTIDAIKCEDMPKQGDGFEPKRKKPKKDDTIDKSRSKSIEIVDEQFTNGKEADENKLNIIWLTNRLIREIKREIKSSPRQHQARISIFKWIAAVVVEADCSIIQRNCRNLLIPLVREISNRNLKEAGRLEEDHPKQILVNQCLQLYEIIRNKVGGDVFSKAYAEVVTLHNRKKNERKATQAVQFLTNPVIAMRRKQKKHQAWKESKKRKKDFRKGKIQRVIKRPKLH